jgi:phosphocarrier protein HPr
MTEITRSRTVKVLNDQGLHARPADMLFRLAVQFDSQIEFIKDGESADGKSILSIMTLAAERGSEISIKARGPDAEEAVAALAELFDSGFAENGQRSTQQAAE